MSTKTSKPLPVVISQSEIVTFRKYVCNKLNLADTEVIIEHDDIFFVDPAVYVDVKFVVFPSTSEKCRLVSAFITLMETFGVNVMRIDKLKYFTAKIEKRTYIARIFAQDMLKVLEGI